MYIYFTAAIKLNTTLFFVFVLRVFILIFLFNICAYFTPCVYGCEFLVLKLKAALSFFLFFNGSVHFCYLFCSFFFSEMFYPVPFLTLLKYPFNTSHIAKSSINNDCVKLTKAPQKQKKAISMLLLLLFSPTPFIQKQTEIIYKMFTNIQLFIHNYMRFFLLYVCILIHSK